jgi:hypothetical protein
MLGFSIGAGWFRMWCYACLCMRVKPVVFSHRALPTQAATVQRDKINVGNTSEIMYMTIHTPSTKMAGPGALLATVFIRQAHLHAVSTKQR